MISIALRHGIPAAATAKPIARLPVFTCEVRDERQSPIVGGGSPTDLLSVSVEARLFFRPKAIPTESSEPPPKSDEREERERRR